MSVPFRVTERAWTCLHSILARQSTACLKLVVRSGGCSGQTVHLVPTDRPEPRDVPIERFPTRNRCKNETDAPSPFLYVEGTSWFRLFGRTMDAIETPTDSRFVFVRSDGLPDGTCGCGESFGSA